MKTKVRSLFSSIINQQTKIKYRGVFLRTVSSILLLAILNLTTGCHYYRTATFVNKKPFIKKTLGQLTKHKNKEKYFVVHQGDKLWHLQNASVNQKDKTIVGTFEDVDSVHMHYIDLMQKVKRASYKKTNKADVLSQVHLYVSEFAEGENNTRVIFFSSIQKIDVYYQSKTPTVIFIMIPLVSLTIVFMIFLANGIQ